MNLPLVFRLPAQAEFDEAAEWYDAQLAGLGAQFVAEVELVLQAIAKQPDRYPVVVNDVREALVRRFPFCIYYRLKPNSVVVVAVFHCSRDPAIWESRD